jgi:hypothetical protein
LDNAISRGKSSAVGQDDIPQRKHGRPRNLIDTEKNATPPLRKPRGRLRKYAVDPDAYFKLSIIALNITNLILSISSILSLLFTTILIKVKEKL